MRRLLPVMLAALLLAALPGGPARAELWVLPAGGGSVTFTHQGYPITFIAVRRRHQQVYIGAMRRSPTVVRHAVQSVRLLLLAAVALPLALTAAACGDDDGGGTPDAGQPDASAPTPDATPQIDATPADAMPLDVSKCPAAYGPASIVDTLVVADTDTNAFDVDGDGTNDNQLAAVAGVINGDTAGSIMDGSLRTLVELRMSNDPLLVTAPSVQAVIYVAVDQDAPADPMDDFSGAEGFYFDHDSVNASDCAPVAGIDGALAGGTVDAMRAVLPIPLGAFGQVDFSLARIEAVIAPDPSGTGFTQAATSRLGGVVPTCPLTIAVSPIAGMSDLWALVQVFMLQPDIDLDGDGLETVETVSAGIIRCIDGDGTQIDGDLCGCDPRIADGYSVLFNFSGVGATLLGPTP